MISLSAAVMALVYLIVAGLVFWLLLYLINTIGLPEPFNKVAHVVLVVCAVFVCIGVLLSLTGVQVFRP